MLLSQRKSIALICFLCLDFGSGGHPSQVKFAEYRRGRPRFDRQASVEKALANEQIWRSTQIGSNSVISKGVLDVRASQDEVWKQLLDFASYPKKVRWVAACKVHQRGGARVKYVGKDGEETPDWPSPWLPKLELPRLPTRLPRMAFPRGNQIERSFVEVTFSVLPGLPRLTSHVEFVFEPAKSSLSWTLDKDKNSDFPEFVGHWHVAPHPLDATKTRVFYETGLVAPYRLPVRVFRKVAKTVIKDVTSWVKVQSERATVSAAKLEPQA